MVAGAPFFFGEGDGLAVGLGLAVDVSVGLGEADGVSVGVGEGEVFFFFFPGEALGEDSGVGVGETFFFFRGEGEALGSGVTAGLGLGDALRFFTGDGDGDFSGVEAALGEGDFSAAGVFLDVLELLRCFRGAGVGVGAKIFFNLLPNDSSAWERSPTPVSIAIKNRAPAIRLIRRMRAEPSTGASDE
jgi:hypothetical protein